MALTSPGVEVTITDESQYLPAATTSVPLVVIATAQNKANAARTGVASATTAANANKLYLVSSQRDLINLYGYPFFYTTATGTPIQGYELNEYGLLTAYSILAGGAGNRCYVLRADIDLASLVGQTGRPVGYPEDNTYWLDTTNSTWGIYQFNATTGKFTLQTPIVITDATDLTAGVPNSSIGNIGDYAVVATEITTYPTDSYKTYFYKTTDNIWVSLGGAAWRSDTPCVQGSNSNPQLNAGDQFTVNVSGFYFATITVPDDGGGIGSVEGVAAEINNLNWSVLTAEVRNGKLCLFSNQLIVSGVPNLVVGGQIGTVLDDIGIANNSTHYQPGVAYGTAAQMPLWSSSQAIPRPTGSVWIKVGSAGVGLNPKMSVFNGTTKAWASKNVSLATTDWNATYALDSSGGQSIPAGSIYGQYSAGGLATAPLYFWERIASGPTVVTGSNTNINIVTGSTMNVYTSVPGSTSLSSAYTVTIPGNCDAVDFVTAWTAANIPYTSASVTTDGAVQLVNTVGGEIILDDFNSITGYSSGAIAALGFNIGTTSGVKYGPSYPANYLGTVGTNVVGSGSGGTFNVAVRNQAYILINTGVSAVGTGYAVGDQIKILGTALGGTSPANDLLIQVTRIDDDPLSPTYTGVQAVTYISGVAAPGYYTQLSNWREFTYTANDGAPTVAPANNTNWFYSVTDQVDIMVEKNGQWVGYRNTSYDSNGSPAATGTNTTDPNGPIVSSSEPTTQSDGTALSYGDLWISTTAADLENYPVIRRWQAVNGVDQWVLIDNTDQVSSSGIVFADARWGTSGSVSPTDDPIPNIVSLLSSNYLDLDAPNPALYPQGMLLFNTRRSGYNVKQYKVNYFNSTTFPDSVLPAQTSAWVTASGLQANGSPYMGRKAQRAMVVKAMRSALATNTSIRDEDNFFNLMATPNYPEIQPDMIALNGARGETAYIIGDTPMGLPDSDTAIQAWATNAAGAETTSEDGLVTRNTYMGLFYPSGLATDPRTGNLVAVPPSHMMLYTFLRNDTISYPWLAAAGTRRGLIYNAANIGYLDRTTGEFVTVKNRVGVRDTLYTNFINPLTFFTGVGLLNYGNKTSFNSQSALDRTNVARLIAYIRRQLTIAARPFVFEPNDALTRQQIAGVIQTLMVDLVAKRGLYDYLVRCDEQNNGPAVIDRNELVVDVAIEPVKAAEFIYIPVKVYNTGEINTLAQ